MRRLLSLLAILGLVTASAAPAQLLLGGLLMKRMLKSGGGGAARNDKVSGGRDIAYGTDPLQHLSFWAPTRPPRGPAPLVLFVHGGGWRMGSIENATGKAKLTHFTGEGYAFISVNYRLVPNATVEQQAGDVASAIAWTVAHAGELGIDPRRIVIMGHSAGAHLVALIGTDPQYLRAVGLNESALAGVVPIDGAAYNVPEQLKDNGQFIQQMYNNAFGTDRARQEALSPTLHAEPPNAPAFLILHVQRPDGIAQSRELAEALRRTGTNVRIADFPGTGLKGHMTINRSLGDPAHPATKVVDDWLKERLGA